MKSLVQKENVVERVSDEHTETDAENKATDNDSFHSFESENAVLDLEKPGKQLDKSFGSDSNETPMKPQKYQLNSEARNKDETARKDKNEKNKTDEESFNAKETATKPVKKLTKLRFDKEAREIQAAVTSAEEFSEQSSSEDEGELKLDERKQGIQTREFAEKIFNTDTEDDTTMDDRDNDSELDDSSPK